MFELSIKEQGVDKIDTEGRKDKKKKYVFLKYKFRK